MEELSEKKKKADTNDSGDTVDVKMKKPAKAKPKAAKKKKVKKEVVVIHPLEQFGSVRKQFILDNIRIIDYRDIASLIGILPDELKGAVESMGIKLPIERAVKWEDLEVGTFKTFAKSIKES